MYPDKLHIRHCMLYHFHEGKNGLQATKAIREDALNERTCQKWFASSKTRNFDLNDQDRSERPLEVDDDVLEALLKEDPQQSSTELALELSVFYTTVLNRLKALGKVQKVGRWVPHQLSEVNISQRLSICTSLLLRHKKKSFLWKIVTGDEKWLYYDNPFNKKNNGSALERPRYPVQNPKFIAKR